MFVPYIDYRWLNCPNTIFQSEEHARNLDDSSFLSIKLGLKNAKIDNCETQSLIFMVNDSEYAFLKVHFFLLSAVFSQIYPLTDEGH